MQKFGILAAAAALLMATPVAAEGYLGARYNSGNVDTGLGDEDYDSWQGEGGFGWNSTGSWGGQVGGGFGNIETDTGDADFYRADGHLYWTGGGAWRIGGVVATTSIDDSDLEEWVYGLEAAFDTSENMRVWGSATAGTIESGGTDADTWNADAGVDFFANENFRIGGNVGAGSVDDLDLDTFSAGINAEIQPWAAPVSIYGGWQMFNADAGIGDIDANAFSIGARWNFGGGTIQSRNNAMPFRTNTQFAGRLFDTGPR
jgi:hypothetical protein